MRKNSETDIMIKLPLETYKWFQIRLDALGISSQEKPHYVKWVRYFLDFEAKYGAGEPTPEMLDAFIAKLASKGHFAIPWMAKELGVSDEFLKH